MLETDILDSTFIIFKMSEKVLHDEKRTSNNYDLHKIKGISDIAMSIL